MIKRKITNLLKFIKSIAADRKRPKIYLAHLEAAIVEFRMREEMRKQFPQNW